MNKAALQLVILLIFSAAWPASAKLVKYQLNVTQQPINLSGKQTVDFALTVNGGIPAPTLEFTEGDDAEITVTNNIPTGEELSIHWHGLLLPPEEDGVAYVNTPPIHKGKSHTFRFKIRQHGTYWYHSHTALQEQKGVYGAFIIHPKKKTLQYDKDLVVVLSDWSDENGDQILKNLKKDGDYYLYKKDSMRSYAGAIKAGGLGTTLKNEWDRMGGMDLSDVGYDAFLINGKKDPHLLTAHPGEKIRLRIINAAASSYFYVSLGNLPMQVVSADGVDIDPRMANEILIGMAETYDVIFSPPEHKNYELRATVQDVTGSASGWIGMAQAEKVKAVDKPLPDLYAPMDHGAGHAGHEASQSGDHSAHAGHKSQAQAPTDPGKGHEGHNMVPAEDHSAHAGHTAKPAQMDHSKMDHSKMDHSKMDHSKMDHSKMDHSTHKAHGSHGQTPPSAAPTGPVIGTLTVDDLKAQAPTTISAKKVHEVKLVLGGDMERYVWHINNKAIHEDTYIEIQEGDMVRFTFMNDTMMHHPMHLHGHFFRVLNKNGEYSPMKHTVDVGPHMTRTIEFFANEPGQWMLHCHNLYHMKTGMARVVKYSSWNPKPEMAEIQKQDPHLHDHKYFYGSIGAATNQAEGFFRVSDTWNEYSLRVESRKDDDWEAEGDLFYRRWFNNFTNVIVGGSAVHGDARGELGVGYLLPMLIETQLLVDHKGKLRVDLEKRFQWTKTIFTEAEYTWRQDEELGDESTISLMYQPQWSWAAGVKYTGESIGVGFQYQF